MERRHFLKLALGFVAGGTALAASAQAAPLMPAPLVGWQLPANPDAQPAVTSGDEVDRLTPEEVRWGRGRVAVVAAGAAGAGAGAAGWGWRRQVLGLAAAAVLAPPSPLLAPPLLVSQCCRQGWHGSPCLVRAVARSSAWFRSSRSAN